VDSDGFSWVPFLNTLFNQLLGLGNPEYTPLNKLLHVQVMLQLKKHACSRASASSGFASASVFSNAKR